MNDEQAAIFDRMLPLTRAVKLPTIRSGEYGDVRDAMGMRLVVEGLLEDVTDSTYPTSKQRQAYGMFETPKTFRIYRITEKGRQYVRDNEAEFQAILDGMWSE